MVVIFTIVINMGCGAVCSTLNKRSKVRSEKTLLGALSSELVPPTKKANKQFHKVYVHLPSRFMRNSATTSLDSNFLVFE